MIDTTLSDFNTYVRYFGIRVFLVSGRVFDLAPDNWEKISCLWYQKHGLLELPNDRYIGKLPNGQDTVRYHSVDELVLKWEPHQQLEGIGQHIYEGWMAKKAENEKNRKADPVVILPPPVEPPPMPKPVELPPKVEEPKPPKKPFKINWVLVATILSGIAFALKFLPVPAFVLGIIDVILKIIQAIPQ